MSRVDGAGEADAAVSERQEEQRPYPLLLLQLLVGDSHSLLQQLCQLVVELGGECKAVRLLQARALSRDGLGALEAKLRTGQSPEELRTLVHMLPCCKLQSPLVGVRVDAHAVVVEPVELDVELWPGCRKLDNRRWQF